MSAPARTATARGLGAPAAVLATLLCLGAACCLVLCVSERPLTTPPSRKNVERRAALAIRDLVPPFQQWGTRAFTLPNLEAAYADVEYLTVTGPSAGHSDDFVHRLERLAATHETIDLFLLAHSNTFVEWVARVAPEVRRKLRLVYNTGCFDVRQKERWLELGARSYVGHVGLSESPIFYVYFLRRWLRGEPLGAVVATCNRLTENVMNPRVAFLQFNERATAESTHAELGGDEAITIDGEGR